MRNYIEKFKLLFRKDRLKELYKRYKFKLQWGNFREELITNEDEELFNWFYNSDGIDYTNIKH